jgi:transposase
MIAQGWPRASSPFAGGKPTLSVLEATRGWQYALVAARAAAQRPFAVVNPGHVRDVAKATGPLAKTDALDAGLIAHVAAAARPTPSPLPDETTQPIDALRQRRQPGLEMLVAERHRVALAHPMVRPSLARPMDDLERLIHERDDEIATVIQASPAWQKNDVLLPSAQGLDQCYRPSCQRHGQSEACSTSAKLGGVAPLNDDRGKRAGGRHIRGGRAEVDAVLYMATLTATRLHPVIKTFYQRRLARGKAPKVAITAAMRKFLTILNAMVQTQTYGNAKLQNCA